MIADTFLERLCFWGHFTFRGHLGPVESEIIKNENTLNYEIWSLSPTVSAWPLRGHTALKSILWETLFLDQLHDFSLLS